MGIALIGSALLASCQKENLDAQRLELVAEGMSGNQKTYVNGAHTYWMDGDLVYINGTTYEISVSGSAATISGSFNSGTTYYGIYPASAYADHEGSDYSVIMPAVYHYKVNASGYQVVEAPMAAYGTPSSGKLYFKHLTGAMNVQIDATVGFSLDSIIVSSGGGSDACVALQQIFHVNLSNIAGFDGGTTTLGGDAVQYGRVAMVFDQTELNWTASDIKSVQVPVPPTGVDTKYTIRVVGHYNGTKAVYERKQTSNTRVVRATMGDVPVNIRSNANEGYTTFSSLFETETVAGTDYFKIANAIDFKLMCKAISSSWTLYGSSTPYSQSNYRLQNDIDMSGMEVCSMNGLNGSTIDGGSHTVSSLVVTPFNVWANHHGLLYSPDNVTLKDLSIDGLTIKGGSSSTVNNYAALGNNLQSGSNLTIDNVTVTGYRIQPAGTPYAYIGGFVGSTSGDVTISNSSLTFATHEVAKSGTFCVGGIAGGCSSCTLTVSDVTVDFNNATFRQTETGSTYTFGGAVGSASSLTFTPDDVTITGQVNLQSSGSITSSPVIGNGITSHAEVNTSGLDIHTN